jgi:hypothetical protein
MATAGPLTFDAALLTVPTTPPLPEPFWLAVLRLALLDDGFRAGLRAGLREDEGFRALPLLERDDDGRLLAADFDRDDPLLLDLRLGCEAPLDELLLRVPLELGLVAILSLPPSRTCALSQMAYPARVQGNRLQPVIQNRV